MFNIKKNETERNEQKRKKKECLQTLKARETWELNIWYPQGLMQV